MKTKLHHPPVDGTENAFAPLAGIQFVQVDYIRSHGHHQGEQAADTKGKEGQRKNELDNCEREFSRFMMKENNIM